MHATLYAITFLAAAFSSVSGAPLDAHPIRQNNTTRTPGVTVSLDGPGFHVDAPASPGLLAKRQTGRIEIHWQFAIITSLSGGCESPGCTSVSPSDHLWVDWYANGADSPSCSQSWDTTTDVGFGNGINGKMYHSESCDIYAIFDGPNPNRGAVATYGSGHGVDCGWTNSPDHHSNPAIIEFADDYYFHCSW